jgi:cytochrome d ubiquinol oxidase subunit II
MTVDTKSEPDLQNDFRRRAIWSQVTLIPLAIVVFITSRNGAPQMYRGLTNWWAPMLLGWTVLSAIIAFLALWFRAFTVARTAAVTLVTLILAGWALAQFPHLVTPDVTIENAAAPQSTLGSYCSFWEQVRWPYCRRFFTSSKSSKDKNSGN